LTQAGWGDEAPQVLDFQAPFKQTRYLVPWFASAISGWAVSFGQIATHDKSRDQRWNNPNQSTICRNAFFNTIAASKGLQTIADLDSWIIHGTRLSR